MSVTPVTPDRLTSSFIPNAPVRPRVEVRLDYNSARSLCFEDFEDKFIMNKADHRNENADDKINTSHQGTGDAVEELNLAMAIAQSLNDK